MDSSISGGSDSNLRTLEFGYYNKSLNIETDGICIRDLEDRAVTVEMIENSFEAHEYWFYSPLRQNQWFDGINTLPVPSRIFGLPRTHALTFDESRNEKDIDFLLWALSFILGMKLAINEYSYLDATPLKSTFDFIASPHDIPGHFAKAVSFMERSGSRIRELVSAAIHALFMSKIPSYLQFEQFHYSYMALDSCYRILCEQGILKKRVSHAARIARSCEVFGIEVPDWAIVESKQSEISILRNNFYHESMMFDKPVGYKMFINPYLPLHMQNLACRILAGILLSRDYEYVRRPLDDRVVALLR